MSAAPTSSLLTSRFGSPPARSPRRTCAAMCNASGGGGGASEPPPAHASFGAFAFAAFAALAALACDSLASLAARVCCSLLLATTLAPATSLGLHHHLGLHHLLAALARSASVSCSRFRLSCGLSCGAGATSNHGSGGGTPD